MAVGMNYQVDAEIHYRAKRAAEGKGIPLKKFLELALLEAAQRHERETAGDPPNPFKRKL